MDFSLCRMIVVSFVIIIISLLKGYTRDERKIITHINIIPNWFMVGTINWICVWIRYVHVTRVLCRVCACIDVHTEHNMPLILFDLNDFIYLKNRVYRGWSMNQQRKVKKNEQKIPAIQRKRRVYDASIIDNILFNTRNDI